MSNFVLRTERPNRFGSEHCHEAISYLLFGLDVYCSLIAVQSLDLSYSLSAVTRIDTWSKILHLLRRRWRHLSYNGTDILRFTLYGY
jgi:hypothetical protein